MDRYAMPIIAFVLSITLSACTGTRPSILGTAQSSLQPCPDSPNCVTSIANNDDALHFIEPIETSGSGSPMLRLTSIVRDHGGRVIVNTQNYVYAEFTSTLMRFVDDVEFLRRPDSDQIDVRSASRLGHKDFNVNRERIEAVRSDFSEKPQ